MFGRSNKIFEEKWEKYQRVFDGDNKAIIGVIRPTKLESVFIEENLTPEIKSALREIGINTSEWLNLFEPLKPGLTIEIYNPEKLMFVVGGKTYLEDIGKKFGGDYQIRDLI